MLSQERETTPHEYLKIKIWVEDTYVRKYMQYKLNGHKFQREIHYSSIDYTSLVMTIYVSDYFNTKHIEKLKNRLITTQIRFIEFHNLFMYKNK